MGTPRRGLEGACLGEAVAVARRGDFLRRRKATAPDADRRGASSALASGRISQISPERNVPIESMPARPEYQRAKSGGIKQVDTGVTFHEELRFTEGLGCITS